MFISWEYSYSWQGSLMLKKDASFVRTACGSHGLQAESPSIGFYQTDHSKLWWMVVEVNWLTLYQECRRASVLGPLLFLLYTSEVFSILENKLIVYADDSTSMAVVPSPGVRVAVAESLIRDLGRVREQGQCSFIGLSCSIPTIVIYSLSLYLLSVYRLVLWGWGLRIDRVYITFSQPCTADLF